MVTVERSPYFGWVAECSKCRESFGSENEQRVRAWAAEHDQTHVGTEQKMRRR